MMFSLDQCNGVGGNAKTLAGKAEMLLGRGLDADGVHRQTEGIGNLLAHCGDVGGQLRALAKNRCINVADPVAVGGDDLCHLAGQLQRICALVGGVVVGEMLTDVPPAPPHPARHP